MLSTSMRNSSLLFFRTVYMRAPESCFSSEDRVCGPCVCPHGRPLFFLAAKVAAMPKSSSPKKPKKPAKKKDKIDKKDSKEVLQHARDVLLAVRVALRLPCFHASCVFSALSDLRLLPVFLAVSGSTGLEEGEQEE